MWMTRWRAPTALTPAPRALPYLLPCAAGRLMQREILALSAIVDRPARPLVAILGGARVRDKIGLVRRFLELADVVCIGGAMCLPFLSVLAHRVGQSLCSVEDLESARLALSATPRSGRLMLPSDLLLGRAGEETGIGSHAADRLYVAHDQVALDIGPETADRYAAEIKAAATVFWSGPMGRIELRSFAGGTHAIAEAVASTSATTVVGGVSTAHALRGYGLKDRVSHLSTGGRAALKLLEGRELPGLEALRGVPITQSA
jgi:phosphoglycerate kinase